VRSSAAGSIWIPAALAGALSARFVEQLTGSPTAADVFVFWILVGMLAAVVAYPVREMSIEAEISAARATSNSSSSGKRIVVFPVVAVIAAL
jgi:hypothetical protein